MKTKRALGIALILTAIVGLFSTVMLTMNNQDLRQGATGEAVQLRLSAVENNTQNQPSATITITPNRTMSVLVEILPTNAQPTATDFVLTYDPLSLEYVSTDLFTANFGVLLKKEVDTTNGRIRLAIGKQPDSTATGTQHLVSFTFRTKNAVGNSAVGIDAQSAKIAATGLTNNVYQSPTTPINLTIAEEASETLKTTIQLAFKFAGLPVEHNPNFLPEAARAQTVKITLQNMATGEITVPAAVISRFVVGQTDGLSQYFSLSNPLASTTLATGKYNILLKGPKHQQIRFCKNEQIADYRCQITDGIDITKDVEHTFNFVNKPLACGDLPISGTNKDQQDGVVRVTDYSFMVGCLSKRTDAACVARADCNADGTVTNLDMDLLLETLSTAYDQ